VFSDGLEASFDANKTAQFTSTSRTVLPAHIQEKQAAFLQRDQFKRKILSGGKFQFLRIIALSHQS